MKRQLLLIQREFWEHRMLWVAPLAVALIVLLGVIALPGRIADLSALFYVVTAIVAVSYFLDCLHAERRDRSLLFWRSLPVSDTATVLTKLLVGLVLLPLGTFAIAGVTSLLAAVSLHGGGFEPPAAFSWEPLAWLHAQRFMLYTLTAALLWYAPYAAYFLLVSAWARRSVYAWAFLPPVLAVVLERLLFGTHYIGHALERDFRQLTALTSDPARLLRSPELWLGLTAAALMIWAAIQVRRRRDDS